MTERRDAIGPAVAVAGVLAVLAVIVWQWRSTVFSRGRAGLPADAWDHVKQQYALVVEAPTSATLPSHVIDRILKTNPFSPQRRPVTASGTAESGGSSEGSATPPQPQFRYKGRVNLGSRQRAIVEDLSVRKTYFLEVGQDVAGFKVLDIAENQVVLSDLRTQKQLVVSLKATEGSRD